MKQPDGSLEPNGFKEYGNPMLAKKRGLEIGPVFSVDEAKWFKGAGDMNKRARNLADIIWDYVQEADINRKHESDPLNIDYARIREICSAAIEPLQERLDRCEGLLQSFDEESIVEDGLSNRIGFYFHTYPREVKS